MIYERLKNLCNEHDTSPTALCEKITGSRGNLPTWQKGNIRNDYLISIAKEFNVTTDYLLCLSNSPNPPNEEQAPPVKQGTLALQKGFERLGLKKNDQDLTDKELSVLLDYFEKNADFIKARLKQEIS